MITKFQNYIVPNLSIFKRKSTLRNYQSTAEVGLLCTEIDVYL